MSIVHTAQLKEARVRRPRARKKEIIMGSLAERIAALGDVNNLEDVVSHAKRLLELLDELDRATSKEPAGEE